ncbi:MAG: serine acetyltransferase [Polyangiaceae bacterium]|nr:serine acetyltransferase [Polyangiaceae bacterium]
MANGDHGPALAKLVDALCASYRSDPRAQRINRHFLPSREASIEILRLLLGLLYPGYYGREDLDDANVAYHVGVALSQAREKLAAQVERCLCYGDEEQGDADVPRCRSHATELTDIFLTGLPELRARLILDVQAAYDGDPASLNLDEIVLAYPGLLAVSVYRVAHELDMLGVPMMPRIMTEWAHAQTGADIHPSARIGKRFFLDHATGAVIGATSVIGDDVKLYQGVTLGALSFPKDANGKVIRGTKRHPTVEDRVTIYANATVLGGQTVVGAGSIIGGSVFVTKSVPAGSRVALKPAELAIDAIKTKSADQPIDFEI